MAISHPQKNQTVLQQRWQARCQQGDFSPTVMGVGTIRVFGKSGDAHVLFPRIESLAALDQLADDERWALDVAQEIVSAAQAKRRPIVATQPPRAGLTPTPTPIRQFDPKVENILILSLTRGG